ncbi:TPA: hypothetical protein ACJCPU_001923, partial [Neisseria meningitidis]
WPFSVRESCTSNANPPAFEYCRYPKVWIPACTGMTAERFQLFLNKFLQRWIFRFPLSRE